MLHAQIAYNILYYLR